MFKIMTGQVLLVLCCTVYLIWWYRGFRPGTDVSRVGGVNGLLLLITAALGLAGVVMSLISVGEVTGYKIKPEFILFGGIAVYIASLLITRNVFHRIVTTELILIVGWTMLELAVSDRLNAAGALPDKCFYAMVIIIAAAFIFSMILYVAYYRMEEMKAFYAAMLPLVTEGLSMLVLIIMLAAAR